MMADERPMSPPDPADAPAVESLLTQTLADYASRVEPPADAQARMEAHLDRTKPARQPPLATIRWALAGAVALLLLLLLSPVGRATAAGIGHAAHNVIITVRDAVTGSDEGTRAPARGTTATGTGIPGSATLGSGSATAGSGSATARSGGTGTGTIAGTAGPGATVGTPRSGTMPPGTATGPSAATATPASMPAPLLATATAPATSTPVGASARASPSP
jgi:hypothetical protein